MNSLAPYQLLEINVISAQDLAKMSRSMKTYALAWVHPDRKLTTRVDENGSTNPTWNDKFVFRVDNQFLQSDTAAIMIEIYAIHWFRDVLVGTVRVLVGNLVPPQTRGGHNTNHIGMRFAALQVRRPSGRPKGILNVGVTVLNSARRSMPLYEASAVGYETLMGKEELRTSQGTRTPNGSGLSRAQLRRSHSEKSSMVDFVRPTNSKNYAPSNAGSSMVGYEDKSMYDKPLSIVDGANSNPSLAIKLKAQKGKADSVIGIETTTPSAAKWEEKRRRRRGKKGGTSVASKSDVGSIPPMLRKVNPAAAYRKGKGPKKPKSDIGVGEGTSTLSHEMEDVILSDKNKQRNVMGNKNSKQGKSRVGYQLRAYPKGKDFTAGSAWTESEVGPSPSEVAAAIAEDRKYRQYDDGRSSMLDDKWSVADSEGVMTKLDRWQTQMPPPHYEDDVGSSVSGASSLFPKPQWRRRHSHRRNHEEEEEVAASGKFSCFSNICGYECTIVCGQDNPNQNHHQNHNKQKRHRRSRRRAAPPSSVDTASTYF